VWGNNILRFVRVAVAGTLVLAVVIRIAPAGETAQVAEAAGLPDTPQTALFVRVCGDCHDVQRTTSRRRVRAEWLDTIRQMIEDGAEASDEEYDVILEFLVSNFGAVAINSAKADDLVKVLGISRKDADAIVAFRTVSGNFANIDAIKNVPDIDFAKIEQNKASLRF
jgi:competence ComEA-like helix-hairpin-helix protein